MTKTKKQQILLPLIGFAAVAIGISLLLNLNLFIATCLFWGLPAVYLSFINRRAVLPALLFSVASVFAFGLAVDYLGVVNHIWGTPDSLFNVWLFDSIPIEDPFWSFLYVFDIIMIYECLVANKSQKRVPSKRFFMVVGGLLLASGVLFWAIDRFPNTMANIPYPYALTGLLFFVVPSIVFLYKYPTHIIQFVSTACYLLPIAFANEIVGLMLGHWYFPEEAELLGRLGILGVVIPFEELFFFILIGPVAILTYYVFTFRTVRA